MTNDGFSKKCSDIEQARKAEASAPSDNQLSSRTVEEAIAELESYDHLETKLSAWIAANKPLLVTAGSLATGAAGAVTWIVTHTREIQEFLNAVGDGFRGPSPGKILDFDSLRVGTESLYEALSEEPVVLAAVLQKLLELHVYDDVHSRSVDLVKVGARFR